MHCPKGYTFTESQFQMNFIEFRANHRGFDSRPILEKKIEISRLWKTQEWTPFCMYTVPHWFRLYTFCCVSGRHHFPTGVTSQHPSFLGWYHSEPGVVSGDVVCMHTVLYAVSQSNSWLGRYSNERFLNWLLPAFLARYALLKSRNEKNHRTHTAIALRWEKKFKIG